MMAKTKMVMDVFTFDIKFPFAIVVRVISFVSGGAMRREAYAMPRDTLRSARKHKHFVDVAWSAQDLDICCELCLSPKREGRQGKRRRSAGYQSVGL